MEEEGRDIDTRAVAVAGGVAAVEAVVDAAASLGAFEDHVDCTLVGLARM